MVARIGYQRKALLMTDKTQEELEEIFKKFTNEIVLNTSDAYAITEILIIARDKAIKSITTYINKNYEVKTKKDSISSRELNPTDEPKDSISQENQLDEILDSIAHTIGEIKWREQAKQAILKSYIPIEEVEGRVRSARIDELGSIIPSTVDYVNKLEDSNRLELTTYDILNYLVNRISALQTDNKKEG